MANLYRVQPTENNAIEVYYDVYLTNPQDEVRKWSVTETYEWGHAFRNLTDPITLWETDNLNIHCKPTAGFGADLNGVVDTYFKFGDNFTETEKNEIKSAWANGGAGWLHNSDHNWVIEESSVRMQAVKVDLVDESCAIIEENIRPDRN